MAAVGTMVVVSILGFGLASYVATSHTQNMEQLSYNRAAYVTQAGLEYAMRKIYEGVSPVVTDPGISFSGGGFTIARQDRLVTVTGNHSGSQVVHQVTSPSQADCTEFNLTNANLSENGREIRQIQMRKICLEETVLDKMLVSWTNAGSEGLRRMRVESTTLYNEPLVTSGNLTELSNYAMTRNGTYNVNEIEFSHDMEEKTFTFTFRMGDGSSESYENVTPDD